LLIERAKWSRKALLRFNLPELFGPRDDKLFRALAALAGAESVLPVGGTALLDSLDGQLAQARLRGLHRPQVRPARAIELIGNEAIRYKREVAKEKVFDRNDIDLAAQLSPRVPALHVPAAVPVLHRSPAGAGLRADQCRGLPEGLQPRAPARSGSRHR
jgi:hypothetical protein